jgi:phage terminase small subunit
VAARKGGGNKPGGEGILAQEEIFAQNYAAGDTAPEAAEKAGYADKYWGSQLLKRPAVTKRIMELQRPYAVSWKKLLVKAMHILDAHLSDSNDYARELLFELQRKGQITNAQLKSFVAMLKISASDRNTAVRLVTEVMSKINPKSLNDAASAEDQAMDRDEAIREMMGADATGAIADNSAPMDPSEISLDDEITH